VGSDVESGLGLQRADFTHHLTDKGIPSRIMTHIHYVAKNYIWVSFTNCANVLAYAVFKNKFVCENVFVCRFHT